MAVSGSIKYVFSIFPMFWIGEWSKSGGVVNLVIAFAEFMVWIYIMFRRFQRKCK